MTCFRDIIEAEKRGDQAAVTRLSIGLAHKRIVSNGSRQCGIALPPKYDDPRPTLFHYLSAHRFGIVFLDLAWEPIPEGVIGLECVVLIPGLEEHHIGSLVGRHTENAVMVNLDDPDALLEGLHRLRPDRKLSSIRYPYQSFIEAQADMIAKQILAENS